MVATEQKIQTWVEQMGPKWVLAAIESAVENPPVVKRLTGLSTLDRWVEETVNGTADQVRESRAHPIVATAKPFLLAIVTESLPGPTQAEAIQLTLDALMAGLAWSGRPKR